MTKGEFVKKALIVILVPTVVLVAGIGIKYGYKYYKKKKAEKDSQKGTSKVIDTKGMNSYVIKIQANDRGKFFTNGEFFDAIKNVPYVFINLGAGSGTIDIDIKILPTNLKKLQDSVDKLKSNIKIEKV